MHTSWIYGEPIGGTEDEQWYFPNGNEAIFSIKGRGVIAAGRIAKGSIRVGDEIRIPVGETEKIARVAAIEIFHKSVPMANAGENVGLILEGVERDDLEEGMLLRLARRGDIE